MDNCNECGEEFEYDELDEDGNCPQCIEDIIEGRECLRIAAKEVADADRRDKERRAMVACSCCGKPIQDGTGFHINFHVFRQAPNWEIFPFDLRVWIRDRPIYDQESEIELYFCPNCMEDE